MQWSFIVAGAFVLSLVAFVTGVRMGKGLSDFKHTDVSSVKAQARNKRVLPSVSRQRAQNPKSGKESREFPISQAPPSSPTKEKLLEEKVSHPPEKAAPQTPAATKADPPPKAQFTLQVAALSNPEEARDLVAGYGPKDMRLTRSQVPPPPRERYTVCASGNFILWGKPDNLLWPLKRKKKSRRSSRACNR